MAGTQIQLRGDSQMRAVYNNFIDVACASPDQSQVHGIEGQKCTSTPSTRCGTTWKTCYKFDVVGEKFDFDQVSQTAIVNFGQWSSSGARQSSLALWSLEVSRWAALAKRARTNERRVFWMDISPFPQGNAAFFYSYRDWRTSHRLKLFHAVTERTFSPLVQMGALDGIIPRADVVDPFVDMVHDGAHLDSPHVLREISRRVIIAVCGAGVLETGSSQHAATPSSPSISGMLTPTVNSSAFRLNASYVGPALVPSPRERCGPGGGGATPGSRAWLGGVVNVTIEVPRANSLRGTSYGNAVTCGNGIRLHAFRAVVSETVAEVSQYRTVVLARESAPPNSVDITGYTDADAAVTTSTAFFVVDTFLHDAFIHWAAESAVFFAYWRDLSIMHPGKLKVVFSGFKRYKREIIRMWGIADSDVIWGGLPREAASPDSITYFPPLLSLNDMEADIPLWRTLWAEFCERLRASAGLLNEPPWMPAKGLLLLPRGKLENYKANDRKVEALDWIATEITSGRAGARTTVLYTDSTDLRTQVQSVSGNNTIILNYGSSLFFNGGLARNATIFAIDDLGQLGYPGMMMLFDYVRRYNTIKVLGKIDVPSGAAALLADAVSVLRHG
jgi:hypothetical protein